MHKPVTRISTRGYYDLSNGSTLKKNPYHFYPKKEMEKLVGSKQLVIMNHGLRNDNAGAVQKTLLAKNRLKQLGYSYPVIGYSYDSNTKGAHLIAHAQKALEVGVLIAKKNGRNLGMFIEDFKVKSSQTKIRLMGHSLGSQVIISTLEHLSKKAKNFGIIESAYFFGASISYKILSSKKYSTILDRIVNTKLINYYSPTDEVLFWANKANYVDGPLGLNAATGITIPKFIQRRVAPENHRFASYVSVLKSFP